MYGRYCVAVMSHGYRYIYVHSTYTYSCVWTYNYLVPSVVLLLCSVREFMAFTSEVLVERTQPGQRQTIKEQGTVYMYKHVRNYV